MKADFELPCQLLQYNPEKRLSLDKCAVHPWILKYEKKDKMSSIAKSSRPTSE